MIIFVERWCLKNQLMVWDFITKTTDIIDRIAALVSLISN